MGKKRFHHPLGSAGSWLSRFPLQPSHPEGAREMGIFYVSRAPEHHTHHCLPRHRAILPRAAQALNRMVTVLKAQIVLPMPPGRPPTCYSPCCLHTALDGGTPISVSVLQLRIQSPKAVPSYNSPDSFWWKAMLSINYLPAGPRTRGLFGTQLLR